MKLVFAALLGAAAATKADCDLSKVKITIHDDDKCATPTKDKKDILLKTYIEANKEAGKYCAMEAGNKCFGAGADKDNTLNYGLVCDKDNYTINNYAKATTKCDTDKVGETLAKGLWTACNKAEIDFICFRHRRFQHHRRHRHEDDRRCHRRLRRHPMVSTRKRPALLLDGPAGHPGIEIFVPRLPAYQLISHRC